MVRWHRKGELFLSVFAADQSDVMFSLFFIPSDLWFCLSQTRAFYDIEYLSFSPCPSINFSVFYLLQTTIEDSFIFLFDILIPDSDWGIYPVVLVPCETSGCLSSYVTFSLLLYQAK